MITFFQSTIIGWNKFDPSAGSSTGLNIFKGRLLQFLKPFENSVYTYHNYIGINYITRLRLVFSTFVITNLTMVFYILLIHFAAAAAIENTVHYFLHYPSFSCE